jgi:hypothetical protein
VLHDAELTLDGEHVTGNAVSVCGDIREGTTIRWRARLVVSASTSVTTVKRKLTPKVTPPAARGVSVPSKLYTSGADESLTSEISVGAVAIPSVRATWMPAMRPFPALSSRTHAPRNSGNSRGG